jgi:hypothetical protein
LFPARHLTRSNCDDGSELIPKRKELVVLLLLTLGAFLIEGYHPGCEDAEIYMPGVLKLLHPELFPVGTEFFESHAHMTLFPNLMAASARITHLPLGGVLLIWQLASIFLLLLACWQLSGKCFTDRRARWAGVAMVAALLTMPIAATALYFMDQYMNPRNLAAFAGMFAIVGVIEKKYIKAGLWLALAGAVHPLMPVFVLSYCVLLLWLKGAERPVAAMGGLAPLTFSFSKPSAAYHQAMQNHAFLYLLRWQWYEWLGLVGPIAILWWFGRLARTKKLHEIDVMCRALVAYALIFSTAALVIAIPQRLESLIRLQPTRSLYLVYILMVLFGGGFMGEYVLKNRVWRWMALFVPLSIGMFTAQRGLFPASSHIEWPGAAPKNQWAQAFVWIRQNTPTTAMFVLDPNYLDVPGEDMHGFRAIAQRSTLADATKDGGAVIMFPALANEWLEQVQARSNWNRIQLQDFRRLQTKYGVTWMVLQQPGIAGLDCPYQNLAVQVCRLN